MVTVIEVTAVDDVAGVIEKEFQRRSIRIVLRRDEFVLPIRPLRE